MKVRISVMLSEELLKAVDERARQRKETRSAFIDAALREFIKRPTRQVQNTRDLKMINRRADS